MKDAQYVRDFAKLGFGMFVHFGLYSSNGRGEWYYTAMPNKNIDKYYDDFFPKFKVKKTWAKELVSTAKKAGCKYITLTTRHHEGFSLFDTCGLNEYDAPHSPSGRDLVREFVDECNKQGIVPFFYHTLLDWRQPTYENDFDKYIDYLIKSVEILCKNYGKIGGLWFDGYWDKPQANWRFDELYATIRKYQPEAIIINNTGLSKLGEVTNPEIDCVTFERGRPAYVSCADKFRTGEVCEGLSDHWGYCAQDICVKPVKQIIDTLVLCRSCNCNLLANTGPMGSGTLYPLEKETLLAVGKWIKVNKNFIYGVNRVEDVTCDDPDVTILKDDKYYYAVVKNVAMSANSNVARGLPCRTFKLNTDKKIGSMVWLDNKDKVAVDRRNKTFGEKPFGYGYSYYARVARFTLR